MAMGRKDILLVNITVGLNESLAEDYYSEAVKKMLY